MPLRKPSITKKIATGSGTVYGDGSFGVSNLSFRPKTVIVRIGNKSLSTSAIQMISEDNAYLSNNAIGLAFTNSTITDYWSDDFVLTVKSNGFTGNTRGAVLNRSFTYTAYE